MQHAYTLTWDALRARALKGERFLDIDDRPLWPDKEQFDEWLVYPSYLVSVARGFSRNLLPLGVAAAYISRVAENTVFEVQAAHCVPEDKLVNTKKKKFSWSYTALAQFKTCPAQYAAHRFFEKIPFVETEQIKWGNVVHKALEDRIVLNKPLAGELKEYEKYAAGLEAGAAKHHAELTGEKELAFSAHFEPTSWFGKTTVLRGKIDALLVNEDTAWLYDWKTGKVRHDPTQLLLFALKVAILHPQIDTFHTFFVWLKTGEVTKETYRRNQLLDLYKPIAHDVARMKRAWWDKKFPCRQSGLCRGWCQVDDCVHWEPRR